MAGQNSHLDLKYYETSSGAYNYRQRAFHSAYKLRGDADEQSLLRSETLKDQFETFPLYRRDEHGFRRYYMQPPPVPAQTAAESLKAPFPSDNTALWQMKQGFFPGPGASQPIPKPNDLRDLASAQRPLTFPFGTPHIENRGVFSDTTHAKIGKTRMYATRQYRAPRSHPLATLTITERELVRDLGASSNHQELEQLRRTHNLAATASLPPAQPGYSPAGFLLSESKEEPSPSSTQILETAPTRIPKFERLSADLSRPVSHWNDRYHSYVLYPKSRPIQPSTSQAVRASLQ